MVLAVGIIIFTSDITSAIDNIGGVEEREEKIPVFELGEIVISGEDVSKTTPLIERREPEIKDSIPYRKKSETSFEKFPPDFVLFREEFWKTLSFSQLRYAPIPLASDFMISYGTYSHLEYKLSPTVGMDESEGKLWFIAAGDISGGHRENSWNSWGDYSGKMSFAFGPGFALSLTGKYFTRNLGLPGTESHPTPKAEENDRFAYYDLATKIVVTPNSELVLRAWGYSLNSHQKDPDTPLEDSYDLSLFGGELEYSIVFAPDSYWTAEAQVFQDELSRPISNGEMGTLTQENEKYTNTSIFLEGNINLGDKLRTTVDLGADIHSEWGTKLSPYGTIFYGEKEGETFIVSVGRIFYFPTFSDIYTPWEYSTAEPPFNPQTSIFAEAGIRYAFSERVRACGTFFRQEIDNLFYWAEDEGDKKWKLYRADNATLSGLKLKLDSKLGRDLFSSVRYILTTSSITDKDGSGQLPYQPTHNLEFTLYYLSISGWKWQLEGNYRGGEVAKDGNSLEGYFLLNSRAFIPVTDKANIFLAVDNITNADYQIPKGYPAEGTSFTAGATYWY